jgi:tetratricopeptide (TPR) repeat protein
MSPDIAAALKRLLELCGKPPPRSAPKRLDPLFREIGAPKLARPADEIGDLIWAIWTDHDDDAAVETMHEAIGHIVAKDGAGARVLLDELCRRHPDWAEAWNKRATLAFIEARDADAIADILETLAREPRHYGALAGFGQIALRQGQPAAALAAWDKALALNPHLDDLARAADDLRELFAARPN